MKKLLLLFILLTGLTTRAQVPTDLTTFLNHPCDFTECQDIQLGACPGDLNSLGQEVEYTDYQIYYVTENVDIQYNSLILRNCRLEFRNGSSLIDNGIEITFQTDCDTEENVTGFVFIGGGNRFGSMAEYMQTLSIKELEQQNIKPLKTEYFDMLGKRIERLNFKSKGVYLKINYYENNIVKPTKIIN